MQSGATVADVGRMQVGVTALVVLAADRFVAYLVVAPLVVPRKMEGGIRVFLGCLGSLIQSVDAIIIIIDDLNGTMLDQLSFLILRPYIALLLIGLAGLGDVLKL